MNDVISDDLKDHCFFCSKKIESQKTKEHIIPNSLLGKLGIKEETLTGKEIIQYSRIKVPAHKKCNSEFGSLYEQTIISLLDNPDDLYEKLREEEDEIPFEYSADKSETKLIATWLSKIFYGLFYNDILRSDNENNDDTIDLYKGLIRSHNFKLIQKSYAENQGFYLPSSLYVFKTENENFDLRTMVHPQAIMMKIKKLVFILCIGDGFLIKNYLNDETLSSFREYLENNERDNPHFPSHLVALSEILALRTCIPKSPKFIISDNSIVNMSMMTGVKDPEKFYRINEELLKEKREEYLESFGFRLN